MINRECKGDGTFQRKWLISRVMAGNDVSTEGSRKGNPPPRVGYERALCYNVNSLRYDNGR
jgi:hypothetical protein